MGFLNWFSAKDVAAPSTTMVSAECCGRSDFVVGSPGFGFQFDGMRVARHDSCAVVMCTHCGRVYGVNAAGLYDPAPDCLPLAWQALAERKGRREDAKPAPRGAKFRYPPRE